LDVVALFAAVLRVEPLLEVDEQVDEGDYVYGAVDFDGGSTSTTPSTSTQVSRSTAPSTSTR
jgi:hypothetical protein